MRLCLSQNVLKTLRLWCGLKQGYDDGTNQHRGYEQDKHCSHDPLDESCFFATMTSVAWCRIVPRPFAGAAAGPAFDVHDVKKLSY